MEKSKLSSIGKWFQRRTLFLCGYTKEYFLNYKFPEDRNDTYIEELDEEEEDAGADNIRDFVSVQNNIPEVQQLFYSYITDQTSNTQYV